MDAENAMGLWMSIDIPRDQPPGVYVAYLTVAGHVTLLTSSMASTRLKQYAAKSKDIAETSNDLDVLKEALRKSSVSAYFRLQLSRSLILLNLGRC